MRRLILSGLLLAGLVQFAAAQSGSVNVRGTPTSGHEVITVSTTAIGITADLCGVGNQGTALIGVVGNSIYASLYSPTATPAIGDFTLTPGTFLAVTPARNLRMIRVSSNATVTVQCFE